MIKIQESGENYLETILMLQRQGVDVRSIDIAVELGYTKPSISRAMSILKANDFIVMDSKGYITLTEKGREVAERMYERHLFLSSCLEKIGVSEETAVKDACRIEHVISQESFEKLKEYVASTGGL